MADKQTELENKSSTNTQFGSITRITVDGFKSIVDEQSIEIRPLTILAGANSSGKSSIMQPLLLLKQTLEAPYDPGPLLLNGPNVKFALVDQLLSRTGKGKSVDGFHVGIEIGSEESVTTYFRRGKDKAFDVEQTIYSSDKEKYRLYRGMSQDEILAALPRETELLKFMYADTVRGRLDMKQLKQLETEFFITQNRFIPMLSLRMGGKSGFVATMLQDRVRIGDFVPQVLHLPGSRGNPERVYPVTAVGETFAGTFENYTASVILQWQRDKNADALTSLNNDLRRLGLTNKVVARSVADIQVELLVNRFLRGRNEDMVNIADVGFGVSQTLPVVVALHGADKEQFVYIEQPEIHLHPRAQYAMAEVLADAAKEGKQLVIETHSDLLLLGIQTLVAEGKLPKELVKLHWFTRQEDGSTHIDSANLDEAGAFGDWPQDFHSVMMNSEKRYVDAAEARLLGE